MEFLKLLIKPNKYMCFLCYKESSHHMRNIYEEMEIEEQFFSSCLNLAEIIKYLFPYFEITLQQACEECSNVILKMYINVRRNVFAKKILKSIINFLNTEINLNQHNALNCHLNINLSKILHIENKEIENSITEKFNFVEKSVEKQCSHCLKIFNDTKLFENHLKHHERKKTSKYYNCNFCNYKSLCKTSVQGHVNKFHLKSRPHVCKMCYKSFYHKKNLIDHEKSHAEKNDEICEVCGKRFLHRKNLTEHLKLHFGEKPYECEICSKTFVTSGRRLEHIKRIHSEKSECCLLCDKKFSLNKELTRHMKTVHSL